MLMKHFDKTEFNRVSLPPLQPSVTRIHLSEATLDEIGRQTGLSELTLHGTFHNLVALILIFISSSPEENVAVVVSDDMDEVEGFCIVDKYIQFLR